MRVGSHIDPGSRSNLSGRQVYTVLIPIPGLNHPGRCHVAGLPGGAGAQSVAGPPQQVTPEKKVGSRNGLISRAEVC